MIISFIILIALTMRTRRRAGLSQSFEEEPPRAAFGRRGRKRPKQDRYS